MSNGQQYQTFLHRIEFLIKSGVGNEDAPDPSMVFSISRNGGESYGADITLGMGVEDDFSKRVFAQKLGKYRIGVGRVIIDDPVFVGLLACFADIDRGVS